jgi:trans-aconitate methyltransferase
MKANINTKEYWNNRFSSNDWEENRGRWQTQSLAKGQLEYIDIANDFNGTILDFGCGLGDAIPIFKEKYSNAKFIGMDISESAIEKCRGTYGDIADFHQGDWSNVPQVDVIIASNVQTLILVGDFYNRLDLLTNCRLKLVTLIL